MSNLKGKLIILLCVSSLILFGCGTNENVPAESFTDSENMQEFVQESVQESTSETAETIDVTTNIDIQKMLEDAEVNAADLQKKLTEDGSLKQSDMNQLSYEIYMVWDDLLNELWGILRDSLDEKTMNSLLTEQRTWISMKESEVKKAAEVYGSGSMAPLAANQKAAEITKQRVYELAPYLGQDE